MKSHTKNVLVPYHYGLIIVCCHCMRTPIYEWHKENGGNIVDFHGWDLPLYYEGILAESQSMQDRLIDLLS